MRPQKDPRDLIKPRRVKLDMSQHKLAKASGVSRADISRIENKELNLGPKRARMLEAALGLKAETLHKARKNGRVQS